MYRTLNNDILFFVCLDLTCHEQKCRFLGEFLNCRIVTLDEVRSYYISSNNLDNFIQMLDDVCIKVLLAIFHHSLYRKGTEERKKEKKLYNN